MTPIGLLFLALYFCECVGLTPLPFSYLESTDEVVQHEEEVELPLPLVSARPLLSSFPSVGLAASLIPTTNPLPAASEIQYVPEEPPTPSSLLSAEPLPSPISPAESLSSSLSPTAEPVSSLLYQTKLSSPSVPTEPLPSSSAPTDPLSPMLPQTESMHSSSSPGALPVTNSAGLPSSKKNASRWSRDDLRVLAFAAFLMLLLPFLILWVVTVRGSARRMQQLYSRLGHESDDYEDTAF